MYAANLFSVQFRPDTRGLTSAFRPTCPVPGSQNYGFKYARALYRMCMGSAKPKVRSIQSKQRHQDLNRLQTAVVAPLSRGLPLRSLHFFFAFAFFFAPRPITRLFNGFTTTYGFNGVSHRWGGRECTDPELQWPGACLPACSPHRAISSYV